MPKPKLNEKCWICKRTAKEVIADSKDDIDEDFVFVQEGNISVCLVCELVINNVVDTYMKEKFGRDGR